jgi:hypothetical protein
MRMPADTRHPDFEGHRVVGVDFSGGATAGRKVWVATGRVESGRLVAETCRRGDTLPGSGRSRDACLPALRSLLAAAGPCAVGLDFPFSVARSLIPAGLTWEAWIRGFAEQYPTAAEFRRRCAEQALAQTGRKELRRLTDIEAKTPFAPTNLRLFRQTYYGIRDVLAPLVAAQAVSVLPMQPPHPDRPWLIEVCPASTLKRLNRYRPYKGRAFHAARARLMDQLAAAFPMTVPESVRSLAIDDAEGDALDAVIAAAAAFQALREGALSPVPSVPEYRLEGHVYA